MEMTTQVKQEPPKVVITEKTGSPPAEKKILAPEPQPGTRSLRTNKNKVSYVEEYLEDFIVDDEEEQEFLSQQQGLSKEGNRRILSVPTLPHSFVQRKPLLLLTFFL